jgi:hypothetical protein
LPVDLVRFANAGDDLDARRRAGWFNDFDEKAFIDMLDAAGWKVELQESAETSELFICRRNST